MRASYRSSHRRIDDDPLIWMLALFLLVLHTYAFAAELTVRDPHVRSVEFDRVCGSRSTAGASAASVSQSSATNSRTLSRLPTRPRRSIRRVWLRSTEESAFPVKAGCAPPSTARSLSKRDSGSEGRCCQRRSRSRAGRRQHRSCIQSPGERAGLCRLAIARRI